MFGYAGFMRFTWLWLFRTRWTKRKALIAAAFLLVIPPLLLVTRLCLLLDHVLYPRHRRRRVASPVFITGYPRSGTTFLHRLLALDSAHFTTMRMWEILLAPSVVQRQLFCALAGLDRRLDGPLRRRWLRAEDGWSGRNRMHEVSMLAPEEDDYLLLHTWSALAAGLSAGVIEEARPYSRFDHALDRETRARIMRFYRRCVQRHLHWQSARAPRRGERRYLAKNPALCPKLDALLEEFPDARIVYVVRSPLEAIPSYVSMLEFSWRALGVATERSELRCFLLEMAGHWYRYPLERLAREPPERYHIVCYDDLVRDPERAVRGLYVHFGWRIGPAFGRVLVHEAQRARRFRSRHRYELEALGLERERIVEDFTDVFERFGFPTGAPAAADTAQHRVGAASAAILPSANLREDRG